MSIELSMKQINTLLTALAAEIEVTRDIFSNKAGYMEALDHLDNLIDVYIQIVRTLHP